MATQVTLESTFTTPPKTADEILGWIPRFIESLSRVIQNHVHTFPRDLSGDLRPHSYTIATKPAAADVGAGAIIFVSDEAAGQMWQGSDGTAWNFLG